MNEKDYCKFVFLGLINLLSFLFSIIVFTFSYNVKSNEGIKVICSNESGKLINNHHKSNLALFILQVFFFVFFFIFLMTYYYLIEKDENEAKLIKYQAVDSSTKNRNDDCERNFNINQSCIMKAMIVMFILCQIFYIIELILVPVFYYKINFNKNDELCKSILKNYRDIIIVGFIFLVIIFFPIYIILLVLFFKKDDFSSTTFCNCFTHNITNCCIFLSNCSKKCHTNEILIEKNSERGEQIEKLIEYRDNLKSINNNWKVGIMPDADKLKNLHLKFEY